MYVHISHRNGWEEKKRKEGQKIKVVKLPSIKVVLEPGVVD